MGLFQYGAVRLHSGELSHYKINCDALTDGDLEALAAIALPYLKHFGSVEGVPRGGLRFAEELRKYQTAGPLLIVDDVYTTGNSMEEHRAGRDANGLVIFSRARAPVVGAHWIQAIFSTSA